MVRLENLFSESDKKKIYESAIVLLDKVGLMCNHAETLEYFRQAGCSIGDEVKKPERGRIVKFTEEIVTDAEIDQMLSGPSSETTGADVNQEVRQGMNELRKELGKETTGDEPPPQ